MNFIAPEFLYALGFLAIPILIHLFNFRRYKTVQFSQVRFLKSVKKQTQSTSKLKHFLVLLSRCLAIICLVFAFAQPYIAGDKTIEAGKQGVVIYLDNSFSMQSKASAGNLLDIGKTKALSILDAYSETDRFQLHTNDFGGNQQRWLNKEGFINQLHNVDFSPYFRTTNQILTRLEVNKAEQEYAPNYYLISDLQKINFEETSKTDSNLYFFVPVKGVKNENAFLKRISSYNPFHLAGQTEKFEFTVSQLKKEAKSYNGSLSINSKLRNPFTVEIETDLINQEIIVKNPTTTTVLGEVSIKDYPVTFDDKIYFSYNMQAPIKVLHLFDNTANKNITALYNTDSIIDYSKNAIKQINFNQLKSSSLIILDGVNELSSGVKQALSEFVLNGGSLSIFPSTEMQTNSINKLLNELGVGYYSTLSKDSSQVSQLNNSAQLFKNVFEEVPKSINLPYASSYWRISNPTNSILETVLSFRNGDLFLSKYEINEGNIYLSSVGLNEKQSNFKDHALFVPILFNMALQAVNSKEIAYFLGEQNIEISFTEKSESPFVIEKDGIEFIPKQEIKQNKAVLSIGNSIKEAGHYNLKRDNKEIQTISFNYNRNESDLTTFSVGELKAKAEEFGLTISFFEGEDEFLSETIKDNSLGKDLWKYFILLALLFLGLEILFLRILK